MDRIRVNIISRGEKLPDIACGNFFQSAELFRIIERTPGHRPYMAVAFDEYGGVLGHLLVTMRRRGSLLPPYLFTQGRVYGEGEYREGCDREAVFSAIMGRLVRLFRLNICLYIEFSDLSNKMFGYETFRRCGFYPVHWMEIHNSLHSMRPELRLTNRIRRYLANAVKSGIKTVRDSRSEALTEFYRILRGGFTLKIRRYIPNVRLFQELADKGPCGIFITTDKDGQTIGGCACVYTGGNCYLWYLAAKKTLNRKKVNASTVWTAVTDAYSRGFRHIYFMDVGLPFRKNPYREFILGFGGKPVGTYRWFRCSISWVNKLLSWTYRE